MTFSSLYPPHDGARKRDLRLESPAQLAIAGAVIWLLGAVLHPLAAVFVPLGIVLLLLAGGAYLMKPKRQTMYWRGRAIDLEGDRGTPQRVYRLFFRR